MNGESLNTTQGKRGIIQSLFPDIFWERKIEREKFKAVFSDDVNFFDVLYSIIASEEMNGKATGKSISAQPQKAMPPDNLFTSSDGLKVKARQTKDAGIDFKLI